MALSSLTLVLALALVVPAAAAGQARDEGEVPSELWDAYPLNPREGTARIRRGADEQPETQPGVGTVRPTGAQAGGVDRGGNESGDDSRTFWLVLGLSALALLVAVALGTAVRAAGGGSIAAVIAFPSRQVARRPARRRPPPVSAPPATKGLNMARQWRQRRMSNAEAPHVELSPQRAGGQDEDVPPPPAGVSVSAKMENDVASKWAGPEELTDDAVIEAAAPGEVEETNDLTGVAEEVQSVLVTAQDAAAKIRRKAEEEAERLRQEAAAAAEADRAEAERIRADAEAFAAETRAAAEASGEDLRTNAEWEAARLLEDAQARLDHADAEVAEKARQAEEQVRHRLETLRAEIERQEQRVESILVILGGISSQLEDLLDRRAKDVAEESPESLDEVLRPDSSTQVG
jgi:hypothetical protein